MISPKVVHAVRYVMPQGLVEQIRPSEAARRRPINAAQSVVA
jgi:hypothetical protein